MSASGRYSRADFFGHVARAAALLFGAAAAGQATAAPAKARPAGGQGGLSDVERLVAMEDIKQLKARRDKAVDFKDWATLEALHAPEHHSYVPGLPPWTSAAEMVRNIRAASEVISMVHQGHTPDITFDSLTRAHGTWASEAHLSWKQGEAEHWLHNWGYYEEVYEKRGGRWLFVERKEHSLKRIMSPGGVLPTARA
jgi:hypothetical protein